MAIKICFLIIVLSSKFPRIVGNSGNETSERFLFGSSSGSGCLDENEIHLTAVRIIRIVSIISPYNNIIERTETTFYKARTNTKARISFWVTHNSNGWWLHFISSSHTSSWKTHCDCIPWNVSKFKRFSNELWTQGIW